MRCGSGLEIELRKVQVVNVWEPHRPNDCRLQVAIDSAVPAKSEMIRLIMVCHGEAVSPQATQLTETLVGSR